MLEGGDRAVGAGEGGLKMCEDLRRRGPSRGPRRQFGRQAPPRQCRADFALAMIEPFPDALQGSVTEIAVGGSDGSEHAAGGGALEEPPQSGGGQAQPSDFVREPDADSPPAAATRIAVAAKEPSGADCLLLTVALVVAEQIAVSNQCADHLAMRTGRLLKPLSQRVPFLVAAAKPAHLAHVRTRPL